MSDLTPHWHDFFEFNLGKIPLRKALITRFLMEDRGYVFEEPRGEIVILLLSGGLDSVALIDLVINAWDVRVIPLFFNRNQKNLVHEKASVEFFYDFYRERYPSNMLELVELEIEIPSRTNKKFLDRTRQHYFGLPMRNATMWNNAVAQAVYLSGKYGEQIRTILVGSVVEDSGLPESDHLSILSQTLHTMICTGIMYMQFGAPLIDDTIKENLSLIHISEPTRPY